MKSNFSKEIFYEDIKEKTKFKNIICNKCDGSGIFEKDFCQKCGRYGKVDWIENLRDKNYKPQSLFHRSVIDELCKEISYKIDREILQNLCKSVQNYNE